MKIMLHKYRIRNTKLQFPLNQETHFFFFFLLLLFFYFNVPPAVVWLWESHIYLCTYEWTRCWKQIKSKFATIIHVRQLVKCLHFKWWDFWGTGTAKTTNVMVASIHLHNIIQFVGKNIKIKLKNNNKNQKILLLVFTFVDSQGMMNSLSSGV